MSDQNEDDFLTKRLLAERYKKNPKTIERWTASGVLPAPDMVVASNRIGSGKQSKTVNVSVWASTTQRR